MLGERLATELFYHLETEGYVEREKIKGIKDAGKPTQLLKDTLKINPDRVVPQGEIFAPYAEVIAKRISELATKIEIERHKTKRKVRLNKQVLYSDDFKALWEKIKHKSIYSVEFDVDEFKNKCVEALNELEVAKILYNIERATIQIDSDTGVKDKDGVKSDFGAISLKGKLRIPDIIRYLQNETGLKRQTLIEMLSTTQTLGKVVYNPQLYMELVRNTIRRLMQHELVAGLTYT